MSKIIDFFKIIGNSPDVKKNQKANKENLKYKEQQDEDVLSDELINVLEEIDKKAKKVWGYDTEAVKKLKLNKNDEKADLKIDSKLINAKKIEEKETYKGKGRGIAR